MSQLDNIYNELGDSFYWEGFTNTWEPYDDPEIVKARKDFKQQIKDLVKELSNEFYTKAFNNCGHCEECEHYYGEWVDFREKVSKL